MVKIGDQVKVWGAQQHWYEKIQTLVELRPDGVIARNSSGYLGVFAGCSKISSKPEYHLKDVISQFATLQSEVSRLEGLVDAQADYIRFLENEITMSGLNFGKVGTDIANAHLSKIALLSRASKKEETQNKEA